MFLTVLKEQSFGSDHFLVLFSMKSIKKRKKKKKSALKGVWPFSLPGWWGWHRAGLGWRGLALAPLVLGLNRKIKKAKNPPTPACFHARKTKPDFALFGAGGGWVWCLNSV